MLSSSDAKWKCLWYMFIWSIQLTLVSQFLSIKDHVAFYLFAALSVLILPLLTSIYSNTAGQHGAGLLRFGLVLCDPVLACISVTPVLLLNKLPGIMDEYKCFSCNTQWNETYACIKNTTEAINIDIYNTLKPNEVDIVQLRQQNKTKFLVVQMSIVIPIILVLLMGRRTRKMNFNTYILCFAYWFLAAMESAGLLEIMLLRNQYEHMIFTTETITVIAMIVTNSYAIVTLCSFITPMGLVDNKRAKNKFDFLYRMFLAVSGILFAEIPLLVARLQIVAADVDIVLPGSFYIWFIKDILWLVLIAVLVYVQRFGQKYLRIPCKPRFSDKKLYFQPEKRDAYINEYRRNRNKHEPVLVVTKSLLTKSCSEPNMMSTCRREINDFGSTSKSTTDIDMVGQTTTKEEKPARPLLPLTIKLPSDKAGDSKKKTNKKRVTFRIDLGRGRFREMKPRSDSPPVFGIENENI